MGRFANALQVGMLDRQHREDRKLNQQEIEHSEREQRLKNARDGLNQVVEVIVQARQQGADTVSLTPLAAQAEKTYQMLSATGDVPEQSLLAVQQILENALNTPSQQEAFETELQQTKRETVAKETAKAEVAEDFQKPETKVVGGELVQVTSKGNGFEVKTIHKPKKEGGEKEAKTTAGQTIFDRELLVNRFGQDSQQVKAFNDLVNADDSVSLSDEAGIRKEYTKQSTNFIDQSDAIKRVDAAAKEDSPAGDLALIFNFMKIQDPESVVRESEFETAQNATSLPGRLGAAAQRTISGERILPEQRQDFVNTAKSLFKTKLESQLKLEQVFKKVAEGAGVKNVDNVIVDYIGDMRDNKGFFVSGEPIKTATDPNTGKKVGFFEGVGWVEI